MQWLIDFFSGFGDFFKTAWDFLSSTIQGLGEILKMIPFVFNYVTSAIGFLPSILTATVSVSLLIYIIYMILGRDGGD